MYARTQRKPVRARINLDDGWSSLVALLPAIPLPPSRLSLSTHRLYPKPRTLSLSLSLSRANPIIRVLRLARPSNSICLIASAKLSILPFSFPLSVLQVFRHFRRQVAGSYRDFLETCLSDEESRVTQRKRFFYNECTYVDFV